MKAARTNISVSLSRCFNKNFRFLTRRIINVRVGHHVIFIMEKEIQVTRLR